MLADRKLPFKAVLINDTSANNHHGCMLVTKNIHTYCKNNSIEIIKTVKINERWDIPENVNAIKRSHILLVNGEGTMHHSKSKASILASSAMFCREHGVLPVLFNSVYQSNNDYINQAMPHFKLIFVRESRSKAALNKIGVRSIVVPDMTFALDSIPDTRERKYTLFTDSVDNKLTNELYCLHEKSEGSKFITTRIHALKKRGRNVRCSSIKKYIKSMIFPVGRLSKAKKKKPMLNAKINDIFISSTDDFIDVIANAQFVITGRFHIVCLALQTKTPFLALASNTHKVEGLLSDSGLNNRLVTMQQLVNNDLSRYMQFSKTETERVSQYCENAKNGISKMFKQIQFEAMHEHHE